jgi:hypothetical protein
MTLAIAGFVASLFVACAIAWSAYAFTRNSLRSLMDGVVRRSAATEFYLRAFLICLIFGAASAALGNRWDPSTGAGMEKVWSGMTLLSTLTMTLLVILLCFVIIISILVAALGRRASEPPVCLKCGYSLKGLVDEIRCPECGERFVGAQRL